MSSLDLNLVIVFSFVILTFTSICMLVVLVPVALQLSKTLSSAQSLIDLVNDDFEPTIKGVKESIGNVKTLVKTGSKTIRAGINEAGVIILSSASGILAGVRDYFCSYKNDETSYNGTRGEKDV
ncbi:MAG: hypothetical protein HYY52_03610 [Candidatus Melainabacteria bacterium]|nr:hypothetical protein [Candidatus Melainabacteria bacterium]